MIIGKHPRNSHKKDCLIFLYFQEVMRKDIPNKIIPSFLIQIIELIIKPKIVKCKTVKSLIFDLLRLRLRGRHQEVLVVEAALAAAEGRALQPGLVALAVLLEALGFLALAALPHRLWLHAQAEPLRLRQVLPLLIDEAVHVPGERINDRLLVFLLVHEKLHWHSCRYPSPCPLSSRPPSRSGQRRKSETSPSPIAF